MRTLHFVSHTHWDREWYLTFQQFRLKLVDLVDHLLALLEADPAFMHFMLDGQTIVLDDYLQIRPERREVIRAHVQSGRLLIGPWHVLPDEFLVSPEATLRNLLEGDRTARQFGPKMRVGHVPDPFGHIGQLPQILRGFGIESAVFRRGLSDEPCELWWQAPDGSRIFTAYLRDGYGNAAHLPTSDPDRFTLGIGFLRDSLAPHASSSHLLLMHGTDHMEPPPDTSSAIAHAAERLNGDLLVHSTLPDYLAAVHAELFAPHSTAQPCPPIPTVAGELRSPKRHHLLPGVLSTRMWIKQRNHACETLLEKWAEPFGTWAGLVAAAVPIGPAAVRHAWRMLMECHPHDSICGCSVDQVHEEMRPRFDQVDQVGEEITRQSLEALAACVDSAAGTRGVGSGADSPTQAIGIVVFNPVTGPRTDEVVAAIEMPEGAETLEILDESGRPIPSQLLGIQPGEAADEILDRRRLFGMLGMLRDGRLNGMAIRDVGLSRGGDTLSIDLRVARFAEPNLDALLRAWAEIERFLADDSIARFGVHVRGCPVASVHFVARDLPGYGYQTLWARPAPGRASPGDDLRPSPMGIENEFLSVEASSVDGTLTLTDKRTGAVYRGLNRFVDGGDCGDEYNYCPPAQDLALDVQSASEACSIRAERGASRQTIEVSLRALLPASLTQDRQGRSGERVPLNIVTRATVVPGRPRVDIATEIENLARDHRLRVHFPATPLAPVPHADHDGHFEVVRRPMGLPEFDETWVEQPRPEVPQRAFTDLSDGRLGLMIANRGLPEVEAMQEPGESPEIALTLLRCVGWLSRDDFHTRPSHAGPGLPTPGAQMIGKHAFEYSILPHTGGWENAWREAHAFNAPLRAVPTGLHPGIMPSAAAFVEAGQGDFVLSAVKTAEDEAGWIVRGYNIGAGDIDVTLKPWRRFSRAARVTLAEDEISSLPVASDGSVSVPVRGHEIVTVKFGKD